jgi:hypothetical protein
MHAAERSVNERLDHVGIVAGVCQALAASSQTWQTTDDGSMHVDCRIMSVPQGQERWVIVRTGQSATPGEACASGVREKMLASRESSVCV